MAKQAGLGEETVALVDDGYEASVLSERHKVVLRFVDVFLADPTAFRAADRRLTLAQLTAPEIVELTVAVALFMGFSKIAIVLGTAPASMPLTLVPTPRARFD